MFLLAPPSSIFVTFEANFSVEIVSARLDSRGLKFANMQHFALPPRD